MCSVLLPPGVNSIAVNECIKTAKRALSLYNMCNSISLNFTTKQLNSLSRKPITELNPHFLTKRRMLLCLSRKQILVN